MKKYKHIFFDLDHTLWDFEKNSEETIEEIYKKLELQSRIKSAHELYKSFEKANRWVWDQYHKDLLGKEAFRSLRFDLALSQHNIKDEKLSLILSEQYLKICPTKPHLIPDSILVLDFLSNKYTLHLISNGFEETTMQKVENTALKKYFRTITTPTHSGYKKPHELMFDFAIKQAGCNAKESVMIGDDLEADVLGAKRFGMDSIFFNPDGIAHQEVVNFEIKYIKDLIYIL
ncbi:MAG: HAD-IA family hydrolase [Opitutaceae bacterium]|nr:HAD-IA family hydrolase [Cytophagales bacterium]